MAVQTGVTIAGAATPATGGATATMGEIEREAAQTMMAKGGTTKALVGANAAVVPGPATKLAAAKSVGGMKAATVATPVKAVTAAGAVGAGSGAAAIGMGAGTTASPVATAIAGNTMLASKGVCLGLGLGLGAWGPVILGVAGVAGAISLYGYLKNRQAHAPVESV